MTSIAVPYLDYGNAVKELTRLGLSDDASLRTLELALAHDLQLQAVENDALTRLIEDWLSTPRDDSETANEETTA